MLPNPPLKELIRGAIGCTWEHNFYMGTQNGSKRDMTAGILIHTLELKVTAIRSIPMFIQGSHAFTMFPDCVLRERRGLAHTLTCRPLPNLVKLEYSLPACLYYASSLTINFWIILFLLSVWSLVFSRSPHTKQECAIQWKQASKCIKGRQRTWCASNFLWAILKIANAWLAIPI